VLNSNWLVASLALISLTPAISAASAQAGAPAEDRGVADLIPSTPLTAAQLDQMVPKHPDYLGALAPENLEKPRSKPPFNVTGTWFIDLSEGIVKFLFGPPYPKFKEEGRRALVEARQFMAKGQNYRDSIGQCFPPGMPMVMTRVWPHAWVQLPTVIYMVSGFNNSFRSIYLDGREFSDPDLVVPGYNRESIGHWEGQTLVVKSKYFETDHHYIDQGIPISDKFEVTERIKMINGGKTMQIEYIMTDPEVWKGEWRNTKTWDRQDYSDINEVECIAANNDHLPGTDRGEAAAEPASK